MKYSVILALVAWGLVPRAAEAATIGLDLGVGRSDSRDAAVFSGLADIGVWIGATRFGGRLALTSIQAEGVDQFRPSNVELGAVYHLHGDGVEVFFGVAAAVSFSAVAESREQNRIGASIRGFKDPWLWRERTSSFVGLWGVGSGPGGTFRQQLTLEVATMFPSDGASATAPWQTAWSFELDALSGYVVLGGALGLVRPTDRFLGPGKGEFQTYFEPELRLDFGPVELRGAINIPLTGPIESPVFDDNGKFGLLVGLRLGV